MGGEKNDKTSQICTPIYTLSLEPNVFTVLMRETNVLTAICFRVDYFHRNVEGSQ